MNLCCVKEDLPERWRCTGLIFLENRSYTPLTFNDGYRIVREHTNAFQAADAVFVVTDLSAFRVIAGLKDIGLAIPQDISVIGYSETGFFEKPGFLVCQN